MDLRVFFVLILFMGLFLGGGALVIRGGLTGNRRQLYIGLALLALCVIFLFIVKDTKDLY